jgi:hypothetical protein
MHKMQVKEVCSKKPGGAGNMDPMDTGEAWFNWSCQMMSERRLERELQACAEQEARCNMLP